MRVAFALCKRLLIRAKVQFLCSSASVGAALHLHLCVCVCSCVFVCVRVKGSNLTHKISTVHAVCFEQVQAKMNTACNDKAKDGKCCQIQLDVNVSM